MQRRIHPNAILGTLAAWSRRYRHPILFAGNDRLAAEFALRFLCQPFREAQRLLAASRRAAVRPQIKLPNWQLENQTLKMRV